MSNQPKPEIHYLDADGLANNTESAMVVLGISRKEIERCHLASALERLYVLTDTPENTRCYKDSLLFQVGGYDDDPRELPQIPEVVAYFRALTAAWPHWLWFLAPNVGAFGLLFALLCQTETHSEPSGSYTTHFTSAEEVKTVLLDLLNREMPLFEAYGIAPAEFEAMIGAVVDELGLQP